MVSGGGDKGIELCAPRNGSTAVEEHKSNSRSSRVNTISKARVKIPVQALLDRFPAEVHRKAQVLVAPKVS